MHRWTSLIGAMMLALTLWTGGVAHAAERLDCIPVSAEAVGHFDGDQDQVPSAPDQGVTHHHSGCGGHQLGDQAGSPSIAFRHPREAVPLEWSQHGVLGKGPDAQLRPPIA